MTMRGLRALDRTIALPRETQAAARTAQAVGAKLEKLTPSIPSGVRADVLTEGFADAMQAMAIKRDPYVSMYGQMYWLSTVAGTVLLGANFFNGAAAGAADSGVAGVWHNLLDDRQPLKPCLIRSIGLTAHLRGAGPEHRDLETLHAARITLQRNKEDVFEFPLMHALMGVTVIDSEDTTRPYLDVEPLSGGGLEIEGHGAPFLMDEAMGLRLDFPALPGAMAVSTSGGLLLLTARVDGEVMDV